MLCGETSLVTLFTRLLLSLSLSLLLKDGLSNHTPHPAFNLTTKANALPGTHSTVMSFIFPNNQLLTGKIRIFKMLLMTKMLWRSSNVTTTDKTMKVIWNLAILSCKTKTTLLAQLLLHQVLWLKSFSTTPWFSKCLFSCNSSTRSMLERLN